MRLAEFRSLLDRFPVLDGSVGVGLRLVVLVPLFEVVLGVVATGK